MRVANLQLFDEIISGTGTASVYYTPSSSYDPLGRGDVMCFSAVVYNATGAGAALSIQVEHSADGRNWVNVNPAAEISQAVAGNQMFVANPHNANRLLLHFVRLRAQFTAGTAPQCRLRLAATTRAL
jgi:hypothetical protein